MTKRTKTLLLAAALGNMLLGISWSAGLELTEAAFGTTEHRLDSTPHITLGSGAPTRTARVIHPSDGNVELFSFTISSPKEVHITSITFVLDEKTGSYHLPAYTLP